MGILVIFLIFASPIGQIVLVSKRLRGNIQTSIMSITLLAMLSTILLSLIGLVLYAVNATYSKVFVKCDMTTPAVIGINFLLIVIVIPIIGIIGGLILYSKNKNIGEASSNQYKVNLQNSRNENIKRWN